MINRSSHARRPAPGRKKYNYGLAMHIARRATPIIAGAGLFAGSSVQAANFAPTNTTELIAAIKTANNNGEADVIDLGNGFFELTAIADVQNGSNGLPSIT